MTGPELVRSGRPLAAALNRACACFSISRVQLLAALRDAPLRDEHSGLIAGSAVFMGAGDANAIQAFARQVGAIMSMPEFRAAAIAQSGVSAGHDPGNAGGLLGLDFHLTDSGPRLIEINTNPGGVLINIEIQAALQACCQAAADWLPALPTATELHSQVFEVFNREWQQAGGTGVPTVAIVDEKPDGQYLQPEFRLFRALFADRGWPAHIVDPAELDYHDGRVWMGSTAIDFVYNRLTDFGLDQSPTAALRRAWLDGALVMSPHPAAHAAWADKRLLAWLSDESRLQALGADAANAGAVARYVPPTFEVRPEDSARWWKNRKNYYFKPSAGFGGKAAYAGDRITKGVFERVVAGGYLAQATVPAPHRSTGAQPSLKYDIRAYVDPRDFRVLLLAARLYRGQTTNFRTEGGGFAPVVVVAASDESPC